MVPEWIWVIAAVAGYVLVMVCNPLRSFFGEAYDFMRGRGHARLWLPVAILSLVPVSFEWFAEEGAGREGRAASHVSRGVAADAAAVFTSSAGIRVADAATELPPKTRAALSIGVMFWAAWMTMLQFFVLVALYLRAVMPERDAGLKGLIDFAWRRTVRFWPGILFAGVVGGLAVWLPPESWAAFILWVFAGLVGATFVFLQLSMLSGDRTFGQAVKSNFVCWRTQGYPAFWFLVVVAMHIFLLRVSDASASGWVVGKPALAVTWDVFFALVRAILVAWMLAAWVLFFCAKTKNPTRRRIRP